MMDVLFGLVVLAIILLLGVGGASWAIGWPFGRPHLRATRIELVPPNGEVEMELSNGNVYRSTGGSWWVKFPDGTTPSVSLDLWLNDEYRRLQHLDRWSKGE